MEIKKTLYFLIYVPDRFCNTVLVIIAAQKLQFGTLTLRNNAFTKIMHYALMRNVFLFVDVCTHAFAISKLNNKLVILQQAGNRN